MSDKLILLCPGQGAQSVGMGRRWRETSPAAANVFDEADAILGDRLGAPLSALCFGGPAEVLNRTDAAQPAIFTVSVACARALFGDFDPGTTCAAVAGLSLGEYTALHLAGVFSFRDALELVTLRGRAMQDAALAVPSGMVALIGADEAQADALCDRARAGGVLVPANYNAPGQIVISGDAAACDRAVSAAAELGLRATKLAVAGAFHSPLMQPAADRLSQALARIEMRAPRCPVFANVSAAKYPIGLESGREEIARVVSDSLIRQLTSPVRWNESCSRLVKEVAGRFCELAPGKVLSGLMKRIDRSTKVENHDEPASL